MKTAHRNHNRDRRLLRLGVAVIFSAAVLAVVLPFIIHVFVVWYLSGLSHRKIPTPTVQDFGNAGEYFGLVIGVPLGVLATLSAAAASIFFAHYTFSKDDVAILSFVEELMRPVSDNIKKMLGAFSALLRVGNETYALTRTIRDAIDRKKQSDDNPNAKAAELLTEEEQLEYLPKATEAITGIKSALDAWAREYDAMLSTMFGALFAHEEIATALASEHGTANSYLRTVLPAPLQDYLGLVTNTEKGMAATSRFYPAPLKSRRHINPRDPAEYPNDVRQVLSYIRLYHDVKPDHALESFVSAAHTLPSDYTTIEFIGAAINSTVILLEKPQRRFLKGTIIHGYLINLGAAQLLTLYQYIPDRTAILSALVKIFQHRSKAAEQFVSLAAPTARDFLRFSTDDSIRWQFHKLERMIVVLVEKGAGNFVAETYDKQQHGEIPATGYEHQRD